MSDARIDGASIGGLPATLQYCFSSHPLNFGGVRYTPKTNRKNRNRISRFLIFLPTDRFFIYQNRFFLPPK
jgi:hypothetical protein